ncbi:hypothetical protein BHE90_001136 [Fusarium euwallaceae]|uniref:Ubiquitin-like protease family profile domain-containing protein n=1 Tax=Fusarium euwallaceae TaxID=1147111 RepID=A0A430M8M6_9HYPO|nr:hypothetical protein BHE90_001136 [Fusarium euwallaceae]
MNSPPTERPPSAETHLPSTHEERVIWLDQAWKGPWFPGDDGVGWIGTDSSLAYYMVRITHAALERGIPLACLWDAQSPHGYLRRAVMKDSTATKNSAVKKDSILTRDSEGPQPYLLTPSIATEVYEIIMASEKIAPDNTPSEHPSDKSDDGDTVEMPPPPLREETTTARFEPLVKTDHEFILKRPMRDLHGPSTKALHVHQEDRYSPLRRSLRKTRATSAGTTGQQSTAEFTTITGTAIQSDPIDKDSRIPRAPEAYMGSPDLSTRLEAFVPDGLLQLPSSPVRSPEHSLLPYVSSPPAEERQDRAPTPTSPMTPSKKRKRDIFGVSSPLERSVRTERRTGPLTVDKIVRQLTCDVQLTDDILELICQAIVVEHGGNNVKVLSPLWFEADEVSSLPQTVRGLDQDLTICFPIHHKLAGHWTMGIARVSSEKVVLTFHDSMQSSQRADAVERRFKAWMEKMGLKQELVFKIKECTQQRDGHSCGAHAAVCLRRDLRNEPCCEPVEIRSEKRAMLETLRNVREISPIHSDTFPVLRELRSRQSVGASIISTSRGNSAMPITIPQEPEDQVIQPEMSLGYLIDGLSLETLQERLKDAEDRLNEAINARDNAQDTLRDLELNQRLIHEMYPRIITFVRLHGINMDEYSDAMMAVPRNTMPEGLDFQRRRNIMGDFLIASEREGVDLALAAIRENQAQVFTDIGSAQLVLDQRNEEITSIEGEVESLQEVCEAKKTLEKYSGADWLAYFQST